MRAFFSANTMVLKVTSLKNQQTGTLVTAGPTVTAALLDRATQAAITNGTATLAYIGTPGYWNGLFPSDAGVTVGQLLDVVLTIDGGTPLGRGKIRMPCEVLERSVE